MKRALLLSLLILTLWAEAASCQLFQSEDLHRPLVPGELPSLKAYTDTFSGLNGKDLKNYQGLLERKRRVFPVQNRDAFGRGLYIRDLMQAVKTLDEDPYGWHLLGAYYALGHELAAATAANREALDRMDRLRRKDEKVANRFLGDLELRCRANLSRLLTSQNQPREALDVLGENLPEDAAPIVRHALVTAGVLAFLEVGAITAANELIAQGESEQPSGGRGTAKDSSEDSSYPQFGSRWETETLPYLRARRLYAEERYGEAVKELEPFDGSRERAKFWEARFLLGLAQWKDGKPEKGADVLERLIRDLPKTILRRRPKGKIQRFELLLYNLGLLHEEMKEEPPLEDGDYRRALEVTVNRDCLTFKELRRIDSAAKCDLASVCASLERQAGFLAEELGPKGKVAPGCRRVCDRIEAHPEPLEAPADKLLCQALAFEPFSAAFNNLGLFYLRSAREAREKFASGNQAAGVGMTPDVFLARAERALRTGLVGADTTQHWRLRLNLVLVEIERSAFDTAVTEGRKAVEESPEHKGEAAALLSNALGQNDAFRKSEPALVLFLDLANELAATEMPDYLTSVLEPVASGAPGWTHVPAALREKAAALLKPPERAPEAVGDDAQ